MIIHDIKITNFKSIYGTQTFNFDNITGLIKLSGPIGTGKTTLAEAILWGLYGTVKGQNNTHLVAWNTKACEVEMHVTSKNKEIHIIRNISEPLIVEVNGKVMPASNKKNTQNILEEELFDVPKLAVVKMCVISFNQFNSLAAMTPAETKMFLDDIFGFKLFSDFNDEVVIERKNEQNESIKLRAILDENIQQVTYLKKKQLEQQKELHESVDINEVSAERKILVDKGIELKNKMKNLQAELHNKESEYTVKMTEIATLGRQEKNHYNTFKSGKCPTCGHDIDESLILDHKNKMLEYGKMYKEYEIEKNNIYTEYNPKIEKCNDDIKEIKNKIAEIDSSIKIYNNNLQILNENYDDLIKSYEEKIVSVKKKIDACDNEIGEWNEMNILFTKTLRYKLLETLIPHINKSIRFFINKLDQNYNIEYDQEFKPHIFVEGYDKEISYNNLSTGQRKSLDLAIIFGILQNIISTVDFNVFVLDELFSNMDADARNIMLTLLKETLTDNKSVFIINHSEMNDDYFKHKIKVNLENKKIKAIKSKQDVIVKCSKYTAIF